VAQAKRPIITQTPVNVPSLVRHVQTLREYWQKYVPPEHGNVSLRKEDVLIVMLCGFFDPLARSLRTIEQLAQVPSVKQHLHAEQVPKSTLSDALDRFRVEHLRPLVGQLQKEVPQLQKIDPDLELVARKIVAGDGSLFRLAGEVAWALQRRKNGRGQIDSQVRLNLMVDVKRWTMEDFSISGGADKGGEPAAMEPMLQKDVLYLYDRAYYPFDFLNAMLSRGSDFVVRLKKDIVFRARERRALTPKDIEAGVREDQTGLLGVEDGCKSPAPTQVLRVVTVWDEKNKEEVRLLSNLADVPAWVIGLLYRCRWVIELFFRWLKVTAGFSHLLSTSANGITVQFYVAMICTLLIHIRTGLPVNKYSLLALGLVARGQCTFEDQLPVLLKRQRERMLEKARLERKKQAKKTNPTLPG
jgi:hypothetical protein